MVNSQFASIASSSPQMMNVAAVAAVPAEIQTVEDLITEKAQADGVDPILANKIAYCESTMRQFDKQGKVIRGEQNPGDVGLFQINEGYHDVRSKDLGYDIHTTEGNINYAMWLIKHEGTRHWKASEKCWGSSKA